MSEQLTAFLAWWTAAAPAITAVLGGSMALVAALLLFLVATALGPDVHVFPCIDHRARFFAYFTAFTWFVRGVMVLTTLGGPEARHPHWDMPLSWGNTAVLLAMVLSYIWALRLPPDVRARFDRRVRFNRKRAQALAKEGRVGEAVLVASGAASSVHSLGLDSRTLRSLSEL